MLLVSIKLIIILPNYHHGLTPANVLRVESPRNIGLRFENMHIKAAIDS